MKKIFLSIFLIAGFSASAQNYNALAGPYGGEFSDMINVGTTLIGSVAGQGIVISNNNGTSWTESNTGLTSTFVYDLEKDPGSSKIYALSQSRLFSSMDNGATWSTEASTGFTDGWRIKKSSSHLFIVSRFGGRVYRSLTGTSWSQVNTLTNTPQITDFDLNSAGNLFISTNLQGVFRSTDNGLNFTQLDAGEGLNPSGLDVYAFNVIGPTTLLALGSAGTYRSTDNGSTWTLQNTGMTTESTFFGKMESTSTATYIFSYSKCFVSTNGGTSWTAKTHPQASLGRPNYASCILLITDLEFYVSHLDWGTFRTTDGGTTYTDRNVGVTGNDLSFPYQLFFAPTSNRLLYLRPYADGLYVSIDDGSSWDLLTSSPYNKRFNGIKSVGTTIYVYGDNGIIRSTDNGLNFTEIWNGQIGTCTQNLNSLVNTDANTFYSYNTFNCTASGHYLLKSTNGAVTWTSTAITGLPASTNTSLGNLFTDGTSLYLFLSNTQTLYKINPATNAATLVSNIPTTSSIYDVDVQNGKIYVLTSDSKIHITTNGGTSWTTLTPGVFGIQLKVINDNTIYLMSSSGTYLSTDAGVTWVNTGNFSNKSANDVVLSTTNFAYVSVDYAVINKSAAAVIPPNPPSGLTVTGTLNDFVSLRWTDNSTNEDYFIIERSKGNNTSYDSIGTSTRANTAPQTFISRIVSGLEPSTTYFFRVRAKGAAGKSAYTPEVSTTTEATCATALSLPDNRSWKVTSNGTTTAPNVPIYAGINGVVIADLYVGTTSPLAGNFLTGSIRINCNSAVVSSASGFAVADGNGTWDPVAKKLTVKWRSGNTTSALNTVISTSVYELNATDPIPSPPTELSAYIKTSNEIVVTWLASDYAVSHTVERATAAAGPFTTVGTVNYPTTQIIDNFAFANGTTYYYRVKATSSGGPSTPTTNFLVPFVTPRFEALSLTGFDYSTQGISWIDFENDGDEDLLVAAFNTPGETITGYENLGNGTFQKVTIGGVAPLAGLIIRTISVGDINNDGMSDFISTSVGTAGGGDVFINKGNKVFERTNLVPGNNASFNWYASVTEINNDGKLDVVFMDDIGTAPASTSYKIFTQNASGSFEPYELGEIVANTTVSRAGSWADIDNDNDLDFIRTSFGVTAADVDLVFKNNAGIFTKVPTSGLESDFALASRTVSWGDIDNDLDLDLFIGHNNPGGSNMLFSNNGDGTFTRMNTSVVAAAKSEQTYGSVFGDLDNDGDVDLIVAGTTKANVYLNDGTGVFTSYTGAEYLVAVDNNRTNIAFAVADYDKNGTLDVATGKTVNIGTFPTVMLRNNLVVGTNQKWLEIKLIGTTSNKSAIGARIIITTPDTKKQMRQILPITGYGSSSSFIAHFGLKNNTSANIEVRWPSGAVQTMTNVTANQIITITEDVTGPVAIARTPEVSSVNNAANTTVTLTLNEESIPQSGKLLMLYLNSNLSTPITGVDVTAATKSGNTYTFTLPSKLLAGTQYNISVDAGAFKDVYGNASLEFPTGLWTFTIAPAPALTTLSPAHNATSVAANTPLQITFDRAITAVAGKKLKVLDGATTIVDIDVLTNGTITNSSYSFTPVTPLPNDKLLKVTIDAGAFIDGTKQTEFAGITNQWSFTTVLAPDTQAPVISFDNAQIPDPLEKNFQTIPFGVIVTDNRQVASATMWHRKTGEKTFSETSLTLNAVNGRWEGSLPNSFVSDMGFEYYFEAKDNATPTPLVGRFPLAADTYLKSKTSFKNTPPSITLPSGGSKTSWKIIAIPYVFENGNNSAATLLSGLGGVDKSKWRLVIYQSNPENWNENIANIERGKGYFINTSISGASLSLNGAIAPPETRDNLFSIALQAGWNQIGNPYTVAINLADVKSYNPGLSAAQFVTFSNGAYSPATQLAPFEGGFVNVPTATTIKIPFVGQTLTGGRKQTEDLSENIDDNEWRVKIRLAQGTSTFELGYVGMAEDASLTIDGYDMVRPPRFFDYIDMNVAHPEHVSKMFSGDVVPQANAYTWDFQVDSNLEGVAEMTWDNLKFEHADRELFLLDVSRQVVIDMRKQGSYSFSPKESSNFKVFFGNDLRIAPDKIVLGRAFPNPTSGLTTVGFALPESGGHDQFVSLDLIDPMGRNVGTVAQGRFKPGFNNASFDATTLPNGFYNYRLTVQNAMGTNTVVNKLIIK